MRVFLLEAICVEAEMEEFVEKEDLAGGTGGSLEEFFGNKYFGRMNDPTSSSFVRGPCGDTMEFYLVIEDGRVIDIKYYTDGCEATRACAAAAARLAFGKKINEILSISAGRVIDELQGFPRDHLHCSILAVSTLYRAVADYLLKGGEA